MRSSVISRLLYLKLCLNRSLSHVAALKSVIEFTLIAGILLKLLGYDEVALVGFLGLIAIVILVIVGHFDLRFGVANQEASLSNKYNPELQRIVKNTRRMK